MPYRSKKHDDGGAVLLYTLYVGALLVAVGLVVGLSLLLVNDREVGTRWGITLLGKAQRDAAAGSRTSCNRPQFPLAGGRSLAASRDTNRQACKRIGCP